MSHTDLLMPATALLRSKANTTPGQCHWAEALRVADRELCHAPIAFFSAKGCVAAWFGVERLIDDDDQALRLFKVWERRQNPTVSCVHGEVTVTVSSLVCGLVQVRLISMVLEDPLYLSG